MSSLFADTLRETPSDAEVASHQLLLRAGFIRQLGAGIFSYLPLGLRTIRRIETILREEMDALGGNEISLPVVHPADPWKRSGRYTSIDAELLRFKDRTGREMVLAMTHEEIIATLTSTEVKSFRQLPRLVYQIQTKFRDDARPRAGLIRAREFTMKDAYSLDRDAAGMVAQYARVEKAYRRIFARCGLGAVLEVAADGGFMGGDVAHEFMYLTDIGEDTLVICDSCGASSNQQVACFRKPAVRADDALELGEVATPDCMTIAEVAAFLNIDPSGTAKAVFFYADVPAGQPGATGRRDVVIMALVRGDMDVAETKLVNATGARHVRSATDDEIRSVGAEPGYASPVDLEGEGLIVVADDLIVTTPNLIAGANREGIHLRNVNINRDCRCDVVCDIAKAFDGASCIACGCALRLQRGVEVGNIFQYATYYSDPLEVLFVDSHGDRRPVYMGAYGIGVGRLLACVAEEHHDELGLSLPIAVAPFPVHLIRLTGGSADSVDAAANGVVRKLATRGVEVLDDDRNASAGVKFADADLIGIPIRVIVSQRGVTAGTIEVRQRTVEKVALVPIDDCADHVMALIAELAA